MVDLHIVVALILGRTPQATSVSTTLVIYRQPYGHLMDDALQGHSVNAMLFHPVSHSTVSIGLIGLQNGKGGVIKSRRSDCQSSHDNFLDAGALEGDEEEGAIVSRRCAAQSRFDCVTTLERLVLLQGFTIFSYLISLYKDPN